MIYLLVPRKLSNKITILALFLFFYLLFFGKIFIKLSTLTYTTIHNNTICTNYIHILCRNRKGKGKKKVKDEI